MSERLLPEDLDRIEKWFWAEDDMVLRRQAADEAQDLIDEIRACWVNLDALAAENASLKADLVAMSGLDKAER